MKVSFEKSVHDALFSNGFVEKSNREWIAALGYEQPRILLQLNVKHFPMLLYLTIYIRIAPYKIYFGQNRRNDLILPNTT